jgi:hypothetical protein
MRRIKSAPANLCNMCHRKIQSLKKSEPKTVIINDNKTVKVTEIKSKRQVLSTSSNIITDAINESNTLSFEENYIVGFILTYIFENIIKKDKFKNLEAFIIQNGVRFLFSYLMHKHIVIDLVQGIHLH